MSIYNMQCSNCGAYLVIDDGDCYAGGDREMEIIFCPNCEHQLPSVYTSGIPHVYYDQTKEEVTMNRIKKCRICGVYPILQFDELGFLYRFACPEDHIHTEDKISPSSTLEEPGIDKETFQELIKEWNSLN